MDSLDDDQTVQRMSEEASNGALQKRADEERDPRANYELYSCYFYGIGVDPDANEALRRLHLASDAGLAKAQHELAKLYYSGIGKFFERNTDKAIRLFRLAAEQGLPESQLVMASMCLVRENNPLEAERWMRLAADQNHAEAQYLYGVFLSNGNDTTPRPSEAIDWILKAYNNGHQKAAEKLTVLYGEYPNLDRTTKDAMLAAISKAAKATRDVQIPRKRFVHAAPEGVQ
jgi:TPR repeat protein